MPTSSLLQNQTIALIGCGKIGVRLAKHLHAQGAIVHGFRRNTANLPSFIHAHSLDIQQPHSLNTLKNTAFSYVVITLSPDAFTEESYQRTYVDGLKNILAALNTSQLKHIFWTSSSSVYAQNDDSWVDENSPTEPSSFSGQAQLQAEQLLADIPNSTIVRFSGIYNSERYRLLDKVRAGEIKRNIAPDSFSNRIHVEDCAAIFAHLIALLTKQQHIAPVYLASDCQSVRYSELVSWLAEKSQVTLDDEGESHISKVGSKRCSNKRLLETGYQFIYPNYQSGLLPLLQRQ